MNIVGIICEYDPFHNGHKRQFELIRKKYADAAIVCLMSGYFTQRGNAALFTPHDRAKAALDAGCDLVLQLPAVYSIRDAENFALGAVKIFNALGFVDKLCFGCEDDSKILAAADLLENPTNTFQNILQNELSAGKSFASAQGKALAQMLGLNEGFDKPNNILAISYYRALIRTGSSIQPFPIRRTGDYHQSIIEDITCPSASAIRNAYYMHDFNRAQAACGYSLTHLTACDPAGLDQVLLYRLRTMVPQQLRAYPMCTEGLENRMLEAARHSTTRQELIEQVKTKRYTHARLSRLCTHILLGITEDVLKQSADPCYVRILGMDRKNKELMAALKNSTIPILSRSADRVDCASFRIDCTACDLWALGAHISASAMYTTPIVVK